MKMSWRPAPVVRPQLEVKTNQRPSCDRLPRGSSQKLLRSHTARWWAKRHTVAPWPGSAVSTAMISSSQARHPGFGARKIHPPLHQIAILPAFPDQAPDAPALEGTLVQRLAAEGVTRREVREEGLVGTLFLPAGPGPHPAGSRC